MMSSEYCGTMNGIDIHKWEDTPLCYKCKVHAAQHRMMSLFHEFSNWNNDPETPRLLSFHYRNVPGGKVRRRPVVDKTRRIRDTGTVDTSGGYSDQNIREFYDPPRYAFPDESGEHKERKITKTPWAESGNTSGSSSDLLSKVQEQGLCLENSSSIKVPGGYQGTEVNFGLQSEQPDMIKANREECNACPKQRQCLETGLKLVDPTGMLGGRTERERYGIRRTISEGLKGLQGQYNKSNRALDLSKHIHGKNTGDPEDPQYLD